MIESQDARAGLAHSGVLGGCRGKTILSQSSCTRIVMASLLFKQWSITMATRGSSGRTHSGISGYSLVCCVCTTVTVQLANEHKHDGATFVAISPGATTNHRHACHYAQTRCSSYHVEDIGRAFFYDINQQRQTWPAWVDLLARASQARWTVLTKCECPAFPA